MVSVAQPWRRLVPIQSVPVSPPPMTTTFLPAASMNEPSYLYATRVAGGMRVTEGRGRREKGAGGR